MLDSTIQCYPVHPGFADVYSLLSTNMLFFPLQPDSTMPFSDEGKRAWWVKEKENASVYHFGDLKFGELGGLG